MATTTSLLGTLLPDETGKLKTVKPGDEVLVRLVHLRHDRNDGEDPGSFARDDARSLEEAIGNEPIPISEMFTWPCGRRAIVLGGKYSGEYVSAYRLMAA